MANSQGHPSLPGQVVLVLQGGGALGAYQGGVYEALHRAGIEPDWVVGTSIGAINAALIAGNVPERRLERLRAFWTAVTHDQLTTAMAGLPVFGASLPAMRTIAAGIEAFFKPNLLAFASRSFRLGAERAGYYNTEPLAATLARLIEPALLNAGTPRLSVGAANVRTAEMTYFDSSRHAIGIPHIVASGALPPAFPAVRIDSELYWDGGILSNTPIEAVFDDNPRRDATVFAVHMWSPQGADPDSIDTVLARQKDLQYASRVKNAALRQRQLHRLRHIVAELVQRLPAEAQQDAMVQEMAGYGCLTRMHVVRLLAKPLSQDGHSKDIDFSEAGIRARWQAGLEDTERALAARPWTAPVDPLDGMILHEFPHDPALTPATP